MTREEIIREAQSEFDKNTNAIRERFYSKHLLNDLEIDRLLKEGFTKKQLKESTIELINEIPITPIERFDFFIGAFASFILEYEKLEFVKKYTLWGEDFIIKEIELMEIWIRRAKEIDYDNVFSSFRNNEDFTNYQHEYIRLETGYYKTQLMEEKIQLSETSISAKVYGKYFLFYEYLKSLQQKNIRSKAEKHFGFIKDNKHFKTIQNTEYTRFIKCIDEYLLTGTIPKKIKPFKLDSSTKGVLAKVFHEMYKTDLKRNSKNKLVEFMATIITDFKEDKIPLEIENSSLSKNMQKIPKLYNSIKNGE